MQEGLANICLMSRSQTIVRQKIDVNIPKKRAGASQYLKSMENFFKLVFQVFQCFFFFFLIKNTF